MSFLIFSVERVNLSHDQQYIANSSVCSILSLNQVNFKRVNGCYANHTEQSYLVSAVHEKLVAELCSLYNQDCYLKVDDNRNAVLVFPSGEETSIGLWQGVGKAVAESHANYTEHCGHYYVASKDLLPKPSFKSSL